MPDIYYNLERVGTSLVAVPTRDPQKHKIDLSKSDITEGITVEDEMLRCLSEHFKDGTRYTDWLTAVSNQTNTLVFRNLGSNVVVQNSNAMDQSLKMPTSGTDWHRNILR